MKKLNPIISLLSRKSFFRQIASLHFVWFIICLLLLLACHPEPEQKEEVQLTEEEQHLPENALVGLEVANDLKLTLFASEPMLTNPTNMDIDAKGRIWVCEAYNYRPELNPNNPKRDEGDRILVLEDTDGDGKADSQKVFYQGTDINAALGIAVLGNKVYVSVSPDVFVFTDEDGDDKADKKEILFSGIAGEQHDHAVHAFVFGPDGKLYFNFGNAGEQLKDANGKQVIDIHGNPVTNEGKPFREGMVFRCNPDGSEVEVLGNNFRNNYEVAVDSYGTLWQSDNDDDGNRGVRINYVMEYGNYGYTDEMTGAGWRARRTNMESEIPKRHWHLNDPGVVPNLLQTGAGSPTGMVLYEGELLPERFRNQMIHSDAGPNVVRAYPVKEDGAGYSASIDNIVEGKDQWFRPSDVCVAPDGSLFIADWYDPGVGGHQMGDQERGRIYRVAPADSDYKVTKPDFSTPEKAVEALKSPNMATRYLAWSKLAEWGNDTKSALEKLYQSENPRMRARALWLLAKLDTQYIEEALKDQHADIRITAIRAARAHDMELAQLLQPMVDDESAQVRREIAIALRYMKSPEAPALWAALADRYDGKDRWYLEALGIGSDLRADAYFDAWLKNKENPVGDKASRDIIWRTRAKAALPLMAEIIQSTQSEADSTEMYRFFRAYDFHQEGEKQKVLTNLLKGNNPQQSKIDILAFKHMDKNQLAKNSSLKPYFEKALASAAGTQDYLDLIKTYELRNKSKELLQLARENLENSLGTEALKLALEMGAEKSVLTMLQQGTEADKIALVDALGKANTDESMNILNPIITDSTRERKIRETAIAALGSSGWGGENRLLDMVKEGKISKDLEPAAADVLGRAYRESIREEAGLYLDIPGQTASKELPPISQLVAQTGDVRNGEKIFTTKSCSTCHQVNGEGVNFGPDLSEIGNKLSAGAMYVAILYPSKGISFGYEGYHIRLNDGSEEIGYIASETEDELQLKKMGGVTSTIRKADIKSKEELENSLMTANLGQMMTEQELVDLVGYLSSLKSAATAAK